MSIPANETYPAGGTWFDTLRKSFVDVPIDAANDNAVPTTEFLEAAESLTTLFGASSIPLLHELSHTMASQSCNHLLAIKVVQLASY